MDEDPARQHSDLGPPPPPRRRRPAPRSDPKKPAPHRPPINVIALLLIGAAAGAFGTLAWDARPTTRVVTAAITDIDGSAVAILLDAEDTDQGFGITGVLWREVLAEGESEAEWQRGASAEGYATCLSPRDVGRPVSLGLVTDPGGAGRPPSEVVAWLECGPRVDQDGGADDPSESSPTGG